jgi:hypothetical protein
MGNPKSYLLEQNIPSLLLKQRMMVLVHKTLKVKAESKENNIFLIHDYLVTNFEPHSQTWTYPGQ